MKRSRLLHIAIALALLAMLVAPTCSSPAVESGAYLQDVLAHDAVVARWTPTPQKLTLRVLDGDREIARVDEPGPALRHELKVSGLDPGRRFAFEMVDATGQVVDRGGFVTRSEDDRHPLRFAVFGDSGGQPFWIWLQNAPIFALLPLTRWLPTASEPRLIADSILAGKPDFVLHVGDVIYPWGRQEHYTTGFFRPFGDLLRTAPIFPVLGNHDCMTENGAPFLSNFVLPDDGQGERCFTFRDGPLRVIGLDLNDEVTGDHPSIAYLRRIASTSTEPFLVVYSHYPVRSVYRDHPRADLERFYVPLCRELGVDLILAGHDHQYQRYEQPGETIEVVTGGGGKSLYEIYHRPEGLVVARSAYHACFVDIDGARLHLVARTPEGEVLDEFTIDKTALDRAGKLRGNPQRLARIRALAR